jgi:hypothetical protein
MALLFNKEAHEYALDGTVVPSVTQVLRDAGLIRLDGIPPFILEAARRRGSAVHELVHFFNEGDLDWSSVADPYRPYLDGWIRYVEEKRLRIVLCEYRIAHPVYRVAGTFDVLGSIVDERVGVDEGVLIDVKTGDPEDVAADLQTAAYQALANEHAKTDERLRDALGRFKRIHRIAVRLTKAGTFKAHPFDDPRDLSQFLVLAQAWHIRAQRGAIVQPDDIAA